MKIKYPRILAALGLLGVFIAPQLQAQEVRHYKVTNLGVIPGNIATYGQGLNDLGDVVGYFAPSLNTYGGPSSTRPFVYHAGKMKALAPNGLYDYVTGEATGINNSGTICGYFYKPVAKITPSSPSQRTLAFLYDGNFKPITDGHHSSQAYAINNLNVMVGAYTPLDETLPTTNYVNDDFHAFKFVNNPQGWGTFTDIDVAPYPSNHSVDSSFANAINDRGQIAGETDLTYAGVGDWTPIPWIYSNSRWQFLLNSFGTTI